MIHDVLHYPQIEFVDLLDKLNGGRDLHELTCLGKETKSNHSVLCWFSALGDIHDVARSCLCIQVCEDTCSEEVLRLSKTLTFVCLVTMFHLPFLWGTAHINHPTPV
jgi:hypothetical protein